ncbi:sensor histidine kinase [Nonomuraea jiangxiensis]|uniref:sensor histidine kinase n=1 Tax=Nonomuraea jiangxiensis TaxID=633440 RepID=UPI000B31A7DE|nr:histidine kinase [Nonomuraea jiangxiensis]
MDATDPIFVRRLSRCQLIMLDLAAGLGFAFVSFTVTAGAMALPAWARFALPLGLGLPLAVRRLWPLPVFCFTLLLTIWTMPFDFLRLAYLSPAYALYTVALSGTLGAVLPTSAIGVLSLVSVFGLGVMGAPSEGAPTWLTHLDQPLLGIAMLGGAWTIGRFMHERRLRAARDAERLATQAVTEERLRIARELHDVVTHSVGLIVVKAGVANHVMATKPEEAHDALRVIETASRSALVEMRHLLGVLRSTSAPDLIPAPGLAGLEALVERTRSAGIAVELDVRAQGADEARAGDRQADARRQRGDQGAGNDEGLGQREGEALRPRGGEGGGFREVGGEGDGLREGDGEGDGLREGDGGGDGLREGDGGGDGLGVWERDGDRPLRWQSAGDGLRVREGGSDGAVRWEGVGEAIAVAGGAGDLPSAEGGAGEVLREQHDAGLGKARAGKRLRLPDGVGLSVYRIVQEALTNVVKHAAPARCRVSVVANGREVRIEVIDDGPGRRTLPSEGTGHGLIGMRERVTMFGGTFEAGNLPGRGFRVFARLPYEEVQ